MLNFRSIVAKLPDVVADVSLGSATIQCFCETWLNACQPSPVLLDDQIDIRYDRITCNDKGGVLIYVPCQMKPFNGHRFALDGIEVVTVVPGLPNVNHNMQIAVLYRSPNVSRTTFYHCGIQIFENLNMCNYG